MATILEASREPGACLRYSRTRRSRLAMITPSRIAAPARLSRKIQL